MHFKINTEVLKVAVSKLKNSLATNPVIEIWEHFMFSVKDQKLTVKSSNMKLSTVYTVEVEADGDFSFSLPGNTLAGLVSNLDNDNVYFDLDENKDVKLRCGNYEWDHVSGNVEDFPKIEVPEELVSLKLPENFTNMLRSVYFSISNDKNKIDLNSLCIDINKDSSNKFCLISTDRERLSCAQSKMEFDKHLNFVIPKDSVAEVIKIEPTHLMYAKDDKRNLYFLNTTTSGTFVLKTVLTNAKFPDIYAYLDNDFAEKDIRMDRRELTRALKRIKLTSGKIEKIGNFSFESNKAVITNLTSLSKSREEIPVDTSELEKNPEDFALDINFVLEYLNQEDSDIVSFKIIEGNHPCLVFDKEDYRHVLSVAN